MGFIVDSQRPSVLHAPVVSVAAALIAALLDSVIAAMSDRCDRQDGIS